MESSVWPASSSSMISSPSADSMSSVFDTASVMISSCSGTVQAYKIPCLRLAVQLSAPQQPVVEVQRTATRKRVPGGLASSRVGRTTSRSRSGHRRRRRWSEEERRPIGPRPPCAQHHVCHDLTVCGLRWHGPISVVGAPSRSDGYAFEAPPRTWGRGTVTRPAVPLPRAARLYSAVVGTPPPPVASAPR